MAARERLSPATESGCYHSPMAEALYGPLSAPSQAAQSAVDDAADRGSSVDSNRLGELIQQLEATSIQARDAAMHALIQLGVAAGPQLLGLAQANEPQQRRARARFTLVGIRLNEEARVLTSGPLLVTLPGHAALAEAVAALQKQAKVHVLMDAHLGQRIVHCSSQPVPLQQALDRLSHAAGCAVQATHDGNYQFLDEAPSATPLCHLDSFRVCLKNVTSERSNNFRTARMRGSFQIESQVDFLSPLARPQLKFLAFEDASIGEWPVAVAADDGTPQRMSFTGRFDPPDARRLVGSLRGTLLYTLATQHTLVHLEPLNEGTSVDVHGVRIWIDAAWPDALTLGVSANELPPETSEDAVHHLISSTVLGIGDDGQEAIAAVSRRTVVHSSVDAAHGRQLLMHIDLRASGLRKATALLLRVRHGLTVKRVPFLFEGIEL